MTNYTPNSHKYKEEQKAKEKKIEKVVAGVAKPKEKSLFKKITGIFLAGDFSNVKSYIVNDVIIPNVKRAFVDIISNGANMMVYDADEARNRIRGTSPRASYRDYYDSPSTRKSSNSSSSSKRFDYNDIIFGSRGDAEAVLTQMDEIIDQYDVVSVADMYEMAGLEQPYTSNKYGWTDIASAEVLRVHDGYVIKLPRALPID
ncbi:MAG: hypothetical protein NC215_00440 [Ruminococcus sp.]|nr:hypothetical protein [Ruminococcus sp.]